MSLRKRPLGPIPPMTAKAARGAFKKGSIYLAFADAFDGFLDWDDFEELYPAVGTHAEHPVRLTLALILQYAEGLSDRQAAEAIRSRIDWKYVLRLEIDDPGFDHSVLCEFRNRIASKAPELLDRLLHCAEQKGLLDSSKQRTDSTHVLAVVRKLSRLELIHEAMYSALDDLMELDPDWTQDIALDHWYQRYGHPFNYKLKKTETAQDKLAAEIAQDGLYLLDAIEKADCREQFKQLPSVITLARIWEEQIIDDGKGPRMRTSKEQLKSADMLASPHDTDARYSRKRDDRWVGYKTHFTETCTDGSPRLITNVASTHGCVNDAVVLPLIHKSLRQRGLVPDEHLVDYGYTDTSEMQKASEYGIHVIGPARMGPSWQAALDGGFDQSHFSIDWDNRKAVCPNGVTSNRWRNLKKTNSVAIGFPAAECSQCPLRANCTKASTGGRTLEVKQQHLFEFLLHLRQYQDTDEFKEKYKKRSGIEGSLSQAVRRSKMRRSRYVGLAKTLVQHQLTAVALNVVRIGSWLSGVPLTRTRIRRFARAAA